MPYLSLPSLTAYLQVRGIECRQQDLNLESYDSMLTPAFIEKSGKSLIRRLEEIETRKRIGTELKSTYDKLTAAALHLPLVLEHLVEACHVLRRPDRFYDLDSHRWAYRLLNRAFAIISLAYAPSNLNFWEFTIGSNPRNIADLRAITANSEENPYLDLFEKESIPGILEGRPDLVGLSVISDCQLVPAFTLIRALRRQAPELFIVVGGPFFSKLEDRLIEHPELFDEVSGFVVGNGEEPLHRLCRALESGQGPETVPNLLWRDEQGTVHTPTERVCAQFSELPTPSFDGLPLDEYFSGEPVVPLLSSYGCYWSKCNFCGSFHIYGHRFRLRGSERVLEDMKTLHRRYGLRHFHFSDEALPPAMGREIAEGIAREQLPFRWFAEARFEKSFNQELCAVMAAGGCVKIKFGLESGSPKVLGLMNKGTDLEVARDVIEACRKTGIAMHFFCMVGFPGETEEDFEATCRFFLDQPEAVQSPGFSFYCNVYVMDMGSNAARQPEALGIEQVRSFPGEDLNVLLDFRAPGLPSTQELETRRWTLIRTVGKLIGTVRVPDEEAHQFLYLAHFDGNPPPITTGPSSPSTPGFLPPGATPILVEGLSLRRIVLFQPVKKTGGSAEMELAPTSSVWIVSTAEDLRVTLIDLGAVDILKCCDGRRWEEIVEDNAPSPAADHRTLRHSRILMIEKLLAAGFLHLPHTPAEKEAR